MSYLKELFPSGKSALHEATNPSRVPKVPSDNVRPPIVHTSLKSTNPESGGVLSPSVRALERFTRTGVGRATGVGAAAAEVSVFFGFFLFGVTEEFFLL